MMHWKKLGKIFDPNYHGLPNECVSHAQSPQVLDTNNVVRCYFSTRKVDPSNGKFLSHVAYADFTENLDFVKTSDHQIIPLGDLGCYDEHGIFPFHVTPVGKQLYGYISGWTRRISVSVDTGIGLAISDDGGETFTRKGKGPIFAASLQEPFLVGDPFVIQAAGKFNMWYIFGTQWKSSSKGREAERVYKISHATSDDGLVWVRSNQRIIRDNIEDECQAMPSVVYYAGLYHMVFCYRDVFGFRTEKGKGYRLGYAYSTDLKSWTRDDGALNLTWNTGDWDSEMQCYPHICVLKDKLYLFYNGNQFGKEGFGAAVLES